MSAIPETYFTKTTSGWILIHQGQPLCKECRLAEVMALSNKFKVKPSNQAWIANESRFAPIEYAITLI